MIRSYVFILHYEACKYGGLQIYEFSGRERIASYDVSSASTSSVQ